MRLKTLFYKIIFGTLPLILLLGCGPEDKPLGQGVLSISDTQLYLEHRADTRTLTLRNTGSGPLTWEIKSSAPYLLASPFSGTLKAGQEVSAQIRTLAEAVPQNPEEFLRLFVVQDGDQVTPIPTLVNPQSDRQRSISAQLTHALYDSTRQRIIASTKQAELLLIHPETGAIQRVSLPEPAHRIALSPSHELLALAFPSSVGLYDLRQMTMRTKDPLPFRPFDVAVSNSGWLYLSDDLFNHSSLFALSPSPTDRQLQEFEGYFGQGRLIQHPSGKDLLLASTVISPSNITKFNIQEGAPRYRYQNPVHGGPPFAGMVWFYPGGQRFISRAGHVFQWTENRSTDLAFLFSLRAPHGEFQSLGFSHITIAPRRGRILGVYDMGVYRFGQLNGTAPQLWHYSMNNELLHLDTLRTFLPDPDGQRLVAQKMDVVLSFLSPDQQQIYLLEASYPHERQPESRHFFPENAHWSLRTIPLR
ncbi:MAG: BACON domain-containing protein [Nitritalea sp.]